MLYERRDNNVSVALKRLLTFMVVLSWTSLPTVVLVDASSMNNVNGNANGNGNGGASSSNANGSGAGAGAGGWFNKVKVFAGNDKKLSADGNGNGNGNGHIADSHLHSRGLPLLPGGSFMPPPPPPPMGLGPASSSGGDQHHQHPHHQQHPHQQGSPPPMQQNLPPPPPPPSTPSATSTSDEHAEKEHNKQDDHLEHTNKNGDSQSWQQQQQQQGSSWDSNNGNGNGNANMPPPQAYDSSWHNPQMHMSQQQPQQQQQQQQQQPDPQQWMEHDQSIRDLQYDIDSLVTHQHDLYTQIQNLTSSLIDTEQNTEMQMSQIDLLLEQVADAEAYASAESNAALEYKTNCTNLGNTIANLQHSIQNLETECLELTDGRTCDREEIRELKEKLKGQDRKLENFACGIEMARLEKQKDAYQTEYERKKRLQKKGFFYWLFGGDEDGSDEGESEDDSDEDLEKLQNLARSTLLSALQSERNSVDELENALSKSQQSNSAIAEMVASRDSLIDELNDRVAVFEEDKVVLKAALRQLQKEMKEEAPKTQKLVSELKTANNRVKKLENDIKSLNTNYTAEIALVNEKLNEKDEMMNETDSKMSMISVYVDQLEERLASFAIARRDIATREVACDVLAEKNLAMEEDLANMKQETEDTKNERDEMKNLVDLLVEERTLLQQEKQKLNGEKDKLVFESKTLQEELDLLNDNFLQLESEAKSAEETLELAEASLLEREMELNLMKNLNDESDAKLAEQEELIGKSVTVTMSLQEEIQRLMGEKETAALSILSLEQHVGELIAEAAAKAEEEAARKAEEEERIRAEEEVAARQAEEEEKRIRAEEEEAARKMEEEEERMRVEEAEVETIFNAEITEIEQDNESRNLDSETFEDLISAESQPNDVDDYELNTEFEAIDDAAAVEQNDDGYAFTTREIMVEHILPTEDTINSSDVCDGVIDDDLEKNPEDDNDTLTEPSETSEEGLDAGFDDEERPLEIETEGTREISIDDISTVDEIEEPPLPGTYPPKLQRPNMAFAPKKSVPLRSFRKQISKLTGIHGFFTEPSGTKM